jgi:biopolymer transport protein ExbD
VPPAALNAFLREIYDQRPDKIIFVKASPDVDYGRVIEYIDIARGAGVQW